MPRWLLCTLFLASGGSALVFETIWFYQARLGFGSGVVASSVVLAGFMAGLAAGGLLATRVADRQKNALRAYAVLEAVAAATGVLLTYLLPHVHALLVPVTRLSESDFLGGAVRFVVAAGLLAVPSTAIGMTLPLLSRTVEARDGNFGRVLGILYGVNTAGAVLGTLAGEYVLLGELGVRGSAWFAFAVDAVVVTLALLFAARSAGAAPSPAPESPAAPANPRRARWLVAGFASGFVLLALEVVWLRVLAMFVNDTPAVFATILAVVLTGVAAGSLAVSAWARGHRDVERLAPYLSYAAGLGVLAGYRLYPRFLEGHFSAKLDVATIALVTLPLVLPACFASGALYAALGAGLRAAEPSHASAAGRLGFANTLGAALGSLSAGMLMLPNLGMEWSLFAGMAVYAVIGLGLSLRAETKKIPVATGVVVFAALIAAFPFGFAGDQYIAASVRRWMRPGDTVEAVQEGLTATVVHIVHRAHGAALFDQVATNAYSMTDNDFAGRRYMKLFVVLPSALHPGIQSAMVVGYGIGNTVEALTANPDVRTIDVADISRDLLAVSRGVRTRPKSPLDDPRVHVHIEDGRYYLTATTSRYDLITGEPPPPVVSGVVSLYTAEYFALVRERLAPGGMATYWLPMMNLSAEGTKAIIAAFCSAFADCSLWQGSDLNFMLLGTRDAKGPADAERFANAFRDPTGELVDIGLESPAQLGALFVGDAGYLRDLIGEAAMVTDDFPRRLEQPFDKTERDALVARFQDTRLARERFTRSAFIARIWPEAWRERTLPQFENERLLDDLMSRAPEWAKGTKLLHQVLVGTKLHLPVLLLLHSNPDVQRAILRVPAADREKPEWLPHRAAGRLAERDWQGALELMERTPRNMDALPDLREYVAYGAHRMAERAQAAE